MEQRVEESLKRIDVVATDLQRDLERNYMRKIQGNALRESAKCCDDTTRSAEEVQECIKRNQQPLNKVQAIMKQELEEYQQRLQRCMLICQDKVKDTMSVGSSMDSETEKKFGDCLCACADEHLKLIPLMRERLVSSISKIK